MCTGFNAFPVQNWTTLTTYTFETSRFELVFFLEVIHLKLKLILSLILSEWSNIICPNQTTTMKLVCHKFVLQFVRFDILLYPNNFIRTIFVPRHAFTNTMIRTNYQNSCNTPSVRDYLFMPFACAKLATFHETPNCNSSMVTTSIRFILKHTT